MSQKNIAAVLNKLADPQPVTAVCLPDGTYITISLAREIANKVLTWRDIKRIVKISDDLLPGHDIEQLTSEFQTEESYYQEVLKRFKEGRE